MSETLPQPEGIEVVRFAATKLVNPETYVINDLAMRVPSQAIDDLLSVMRLSGADLNPMQYATFPEIRGLTDLYGTVAADKAPIDKIAYLLHRASIRNGFLPKDTMPDWVNYDPNVDQSAEGRWLFLYGPHVILGSSSDEPDVLRHKKITPKSMFGAAGALGMFLTSEVTHLSRQIE